MYREQNVILSPFDNDITQHHYAAKMFMGDTGSQFIGLFLAAIGIMYFWNTPDVHSKMVQSKQFFVTILAFAIPIIDTSTVFINRIIKGKSPFIGGKDRIRTRNGQFQQADGDRREICCVINNGC